MSTIQDMAAEMLHHWTGRIASSPTPFHLVGIGQQRINMALTELEPSVRSSYRNVQRTYSLGTAYRAHRAGQRSVRRGVTTSLVTLRAGLLANPLIPHFCSLYRVGQAMFPMLIIDSDLVILPGPVTEGGEVTAWASSSMADIRDAEQLWSVTWASAEPVEISGRDRLSERQIEVAFALTQGRSDHGISQMLGVSPRTVSADIHRLCQVVGVTGRSALVARLAGMPRL